MSSGSNDIPGAAESERVTADGRPLSRADLHLHTNLGDGTASPERVLSEGNIVVVFPEPFGPRNPNSSPLLTAKLTSLTAVNVPNRIVR